MQLLERHFDTAFDAPDGIKKLRELILTLAMQGKLVPQEPNDEPASELLKQIEAEKKRLVKQGKIKEAKPLPPVSSEEMPNPLPKGWEWVRMGDFTEIVRGITFPANEKTKEPGPNKIACLRTSNVQKELEWDDLLFVDRQFMAKASQLIELNDIVMSMANSRELVGKVAIVRSIPVEEATFGGFLGVIRTYRASPAYVHNVLNSRYARNSLIESASQTTNIANVSLGKLNMFLFPCPPLHEQIRIVAKIDELMARCDALERQRAERDAKRLAVHRAAVRQLLNVADTDGHVQARESLSQHFGELYTVKENVTELRKAIRQLAVMGKLAPQDPNEPPASELLKQIEAEKKRLVRVGQIRESKPLSAITPEEVPYLIPESWRWIRLGKAGAFERGRSKHRPRNDRRLFDGGTYPFIQTGDVSRSKQTENQIRTCGSYYNDVGLKQSRLWEKGTLCITIAANIAETGFLGMDACLPDSVVVFLGVDQALNQLVKIFIDVAKDDLEHFAPSTAQKNINLGIINQLLFPLPPLKEQRRIVSQFNVLMAKCDELELCISNSRQKQDELLNAMIAQYGRQRCA